MHFNHRESFCTHASRKYYVHYMLVDVVNTWEMLCILYRIRKCYTYCTELGNVIHTVCVWEMLYVLKKCTHYRQLENIIYPLSTEILSILLACRKYFTHCRHVVKGKAHYRQVGNIYIHILLVCMKYSCLYHKHIGNVMHIVRIQEILDTL